MGSGDLNMKKSWHPQTLANQRRVAEVKQKAEEEAQRAAKLQKELREERQREEMDRLNATVTKKTINKLDWMYNAPSVGVPQTSEDLEAYLLGKKDANDLLRDKAKHEEKQPDKWRDGLFAFSNRNANNDRDTMAKTIEDPLTEIKRRERQAAMQHAMAKKSRDKGDESRKKHRDKKSRRHGDKDSKERSRSHRNHRDSHRHRSRSPDRTHRRSRRSRSP
ncbi:RNA-splicing factor [Coemansia sp. RSA 1821]|nr:RNA-splicing factor [Coemansia sp. RSA 1821]